MIIKGFETHLITTGWCLNINHGLLSYIYALKDSWLVRTYEREQSHPQRLKAVELTITGYKPFLKEMLPMALVLDLYGRSKTFSLRRSQVVRHGFHVNTANGEVVFCFQENRQWKVRCYLKSQKDKDLLVYDQANIYRDSSFTHDLAHVDLILNSINEGLIK